MRIIPAIDLLDGKCVRLFKGDYKQVEIFHEDPVQMAKDFETAGFKYLHLVDLDGARESGNNQKILQEITSKTKLNVDFGGGLKTLKDIENAVKKGASQVNIGSMAVKNKPAFIQWLKKYPDKLIWNADIKNGKLAVNGWQETVEDDISLLICEFLEHGVKNILMTDITKDGTLQGPNFNLYEKMMSKFPQINWIASGGITTTEDVNKLKKNGLYGAVIGKAIYKGTITFEQLIKIQNAD